MEMCLGTARIYIYIYYNIHMNNVIILRKFLEDNEDSQNLSHDKNHILMIGINLTKTFSELLISTSMFVHSVTIAYSF